MYGLGIGLVANHDFHATAMMAVASILLANLGQFPALHTTVAFFGDVHAARWRKCHATRTI